MPHVLRHSFTSTANDLGFNEVTIAALVGHTKGSVTSKYIHTLDTAHHGCRHDCRLHVRAARRGRVQASRLRPRSGFTQSGACTLPAECRRRPRQNGSAGRGTSCRLEFVSEGGGRLKSRSDFITRRKDMSKQSDPASCFDAAERFFRLYRSHCVTPDRDTLFSFLEAAHSLNDRLLISTEK